MTAGARTLYLCYFGLREPLVQTQVLPYLRELAGAGIRVSLLTFEPQPRRRWSDYELDGWRQRLAADGITWHLLPYHRRPSLPATAYDVLAGAWRAVRIARRDGVDVFHGRSHVGAAIGAVAKRIAGGRLVFDVRGLLAEGYVDAGHWPAGGLLYRVTKAAERWLYRAADGFVVLTERASLALFPAGAGDRPLAVIPCCVDPARFAAAGHLGREALRRQLGIEDRFVLVYTGVLGGYYLLRETAEVLAAARREDPRVYALVLTQSAVAPVIEELQRHGFGPSDCRILALPPSEVPAYLRAADAALSLIRPPRPDVIPPCQVAMSPTKVPEYLAAGLPVISTAGIGDLDDHLAAARVGVLLHSFDEDAYRQAFRSLAELRRDPELAERCRETARQRYDLETVGGARYRALYAAVLSAAPTRRG